MAELRLIHSVNRVDVCCCINSLHRSIVIFRECITFLNCAILEYVFDSELGMVVGFG